MHEYLVGLQLSTHAEVDLEEERYRTLLSAAIQQYNDNQAAAANPKKLELIKVQKKRLICRLYSTNPLEMPGRAMRHLSQLLIRHTLFADLLYNKHLFDSFTVAGFDFPNEEGDSLLPLDAASIDDVTFLQNLLAFCMGKNQGNRRGRDAVTKMKALAIEAGMIRQLPDGYEAQMPASGEFLKTDGAE